MSLKQGGNILQIRKLMSDISSQLTLTFLLLSVYTQ